MAAAKSRGSYERERVRMTAATVERAARMIHEGSLAGRGAEIADADTPGLTLRITRSAGPGTSATAEARSASARWTR